MNAALLIDSIVRQTTVLVAQLATAAGSRAPLAHTANQVFLDLASELRAQGLGHKVIADMFGLALRTYHGKVRRLSEGSTFRGQSLWSAVLDYVRQQGTVGRNALLKRFHYDDEMSVKGVLNDLVDSGLIYRSGRGEQTRYKAAELEAETQEPPGQESIINLVWAAVHRYGPATLEELSRAVALEEGELEQSLSHLVLQGKVIQEQSNEQTRYRAEQFLIPVGDSAGWEAAVFDHYQAMVTAVCAKLALGASSGVNERIGGSTYHYDVWPGHPHYEEVAGHLAKLRQLSVELRTKVEDHNARGRAPDECQIERFTAYVGQTVRKEGDDNDLA